jgi:hypothetical protein
MNLLVFLGCQTRVFQARRTWQREGRKGDMRKWEVFYTHRGILAWKARLGGGRQHGVVWSVDSASVARGRSFSPR